jgi:hypothetical protein
MELDVFSRREASRRSPQNGHQDLFLKSVNLKADTVNLGLG